MGLGEKCTLLKLVKEQNSIYIAVSVLFQTNMKKRYDMSYEHQIVALGSGNELSSDSSVSIAESTKSALVEEDAA